MPADTAFMEKLTALCKRRGFIYQSSEIYGGMGGSLSARSDFRLEDPRTWYNKGSR